MHFVSFISLAITACLPDIVMPFFQAQAGKSEGRLATTAVLLGQVHLELVDDFSRVPRQGTKQGSITIHDNEPISAESRCESLLVGISRR